MGALLNRRAVHLAAPLGHGTEMARDSAAGFRTAAEKVDLGRVTASQRHETSGQDQLCLRQKWWLQDSWRHRHLTPYPDSHLETKLNENIYATLRFQVMT